MGEVGDRLLVLLLRLLLCFLWGPPSWACLHATQSGAARTCLLPAPGGWSHAAPCLCTALPSLNATACPGAMPPTYGHYFPACMYSVLEEGPTCYHALHASSCSRKILPAYAPRPGGQACHCLLFVDWDPFCAYGNWVGGGVEW